MSAIYALADRGDQDHAEARRLFSTAVESSHRFLTHNYVLVESLALLQRRLGSRVTGIFARSVSGFEVFWVDPVLHQKAVRRLLERDQRRVSFVDEVSFLVMRARELQTAFAFDPDFEKEGFRLFAG